MILNSINNISQFKISGRKDNLMKIIEKNKQRKKQIGNIYL